MSRSTPRGIQNESGTGLIGSAAGVAAFLVLLLFAVQLLVNLYAATTVSAAGLDAARSVASRTVDHGDPASVTAAQAQAETTLRELLGGIGQDASVSWAVGAGEVRLRLEVDTPGILPSAMGEVVAFGHIDRTFVVRTEELR